MRSKAEHRMLRLYFRYINTTLAVKIETDFFRVSDFEKIGLGKYGKF